MKVPLVVANWKMNNCYREGELLINEILNNTKYPGDVDVVLAPPFPYLLPFALKLAKSYISLAAQDLSAEEKGAYTGEISAQMLKDCEVDFVIIGHSERRKYFQEQEEFLNKKIKLALKNQIIPIYCVGETLEERKDGSYKKRIITQVTQALFDIKLNNHKELVLAYEPIWAIGTGETATPEQAEEIHQLIRINLEEIYENQIASNIRILYGGSVTPQNAKSLLIMPNINGALVGGASLKAEQFCSIIAQAN